VPGGVGPMTIAMLLRNTLRSCERMKWQRITTTNRIIARRMDGMTT
jgi:hypothetical protein